MLKGNCYARLATIQDQVNQVQLLFLQSYGTGQRVSKLMGVSAYTFKMQGKLSFEIFVLISCR